MPETMWCGGLSPSSINSFSRLQAIGTKLSTMHHLEKPDLGKQAWTVSQTVFGRCVGKVVELDFVDSPALSVNVDTNVNCHSAIQLIVWGFDPAGQNGDAYVELTEYSQTPHPTLRE